MTEPRVRNVLIHVNFPPKILRCVEGAASGVVPGAFPVKEAISY